jgi:hypothetical protein
MKDRRCDSKGLGLRLSSGCLVSEDEEDPDLPSFSGLMPARRFRVARRGFAIAAPAFGGLGEGICENSRLSVKKSSCSGPRRRGKSGLSRRLFVEKGGCNDRVPPLG